MTKGFSLLVFGKEMQDQFNRNIEYLRVSVIDKCNLYCIYCRNPQISPPFLNNASLKDEEITEVIRIAAGLGINKVRITGGEPLMRQGIDRLFKKIFGLNTIKKVSMTTNGMLLKDNLKLLYEAGLREVNISLDTLKKDRFIYITKKDCLAQVLEGILQALDLGFLVKLNVVVMKQINDDEILDFASLTLNQRIFVRFIELMPIGNSLFYTPDRFIPISEIKSKCESLSKLEPSEDSIGSGPARYYRFKHALGALGFIGPISEPFCKNCNRIRLTSDGILKPCLDYNYGVDLKPYLRPNLNPERIEMLFKEALSIKPYNHTMNAMDANRDESLNMCHIGG